MKGLRHFVQPSSSLPHLSPPEYSAQHFSLTGLFGTKVVPARSAHGGDGGSSVVSGCFPPPISQRSSSCAAVERGVVAAAASPLHPSSPCNGAAASAAQQPCSPMRGSQQQLPAEANKAMKGSSLQIMRSSMSFCPPRSLARPRSSSTECPAEFTLVGRAGSALNLMHRAGSSTRSALPQPGPAPWDSDTQMLVLKVRGGGKNL